jgi:hypothetical protein
MLAEHEVRDPDRRVEELGKLIAQEEGKGVKLSRAAFKPPKGPGGKRCYGHRTSCQPTNRNPNRGTSKDVGRIMNSEIGARQANKNCDAEGSSLVVCSPPPTVSLPTSVTGYGDQLD